MQTSLSPSVCRAFLGCQIEKAADKLNLSKKIISCHPSSLPLPDHVDCFVALNRSPSPYGQETHLRFQGRGVSPTEGSCRFPLMALQQTRLISTGVKSRVLQLRTHRSLASASTDLAPIYSSAIPDSKKEGTLRNRCRHRPVQYLNNILEQDHRAIKRRVNAKQGFREFQAARRTIQ